MRAFYGKPVYSLNFKRLLRTLANFADLVNDVYQNYGPNLRTSLVDFSGSSKKNRNI